MPTARANVSSIGTSATAANTSLQRTRLRSPLNSISLGDRNRRRGAQVGFLDADARANRPLSVLFLQQRGRRAAARPRSAGAENGQILAESGWVGFGWPVFGFRTARDRAYRGGESRAVSGGMG